jgi:hypothetical protein
MEQAAEDPRALVTEMSSAERFELLCAIVAQLAHEPSEGTI